MKRPLQVKAATDERLSTGAIVVAGQPRWANTRMTPPGVIAMNSPTSLTREQLEQALQISPFAQLIGFNLTHFSPGQIEMHE